MSNSQIEERKKDDERWSVNMGEKAQEFLTQQLSKRGTITVKLWNSNYPITEIRGILKYVGNSTWKVEDMFSHIEFSAEDVEKMEDQVRGGVIFLR